MDNFDSINSGLSQIQSRVDLKVIENHQKIISNLFAKLKKDHGCHNWKKCKCSLCMIMKQYVFNKIQLHKIKRMHKYGGYPCEEDIQYMEEYNFHDIIRIDLSVLRHKILSFEDQLSSQRKQIKEII